MFSSTPAQAQRLDPPALQKTTLGVEVGALPYVLEGYHASVFLGLKNWRIRPVVQKLSLPGFLLEEGFRDHEQWVGALWVDWFPRRGWRGFWLGAGLEDWQGRIGHEQETMRGAFTHLIMALGGGYVWKPFLRVNDNRLRNLYLNPWLGIHANIQGNESVKVGQQQWTPGVFVPEASIKLGWHY